MAIFSALGGMMNAGSTRAAGDMAAGAGRDAYDQSTDWAKVLRSWITPWSAPGEAASNELTKLYGLGHTYQSGDTYKDWMVDQTNRQVDADNALAMFRTSPGYKFRLDQGRRNLENSASARGMQLSGAQVQGLEDYSQGRASDEFDNYTNALRHISGQGLQAMSGAAGNATSLGGQGINALAQGGFRRADAYGAAGNQLASGISRGVNNLITAGAYSDWGNDIWGSGGRRPNISGARV